MKPQNVSVISEMELNDATEETTDEELTGNETDDTSQDEINNEVLKKRIKKNTVNHYGLFLN